MPTSYTLGFVPLPPRYCLFLAFMLLGYATLTQVVKTMVHSQVWRMMVVAAERIASAARSRARSFAAGADHSGSLLPREGLCPRATKHALGVNDFIKMVGNFRASGCAAPLSTDDRPSLGP